MARRDCLARYLSPNDSQNQNLRAGLRDGFLGLALRAAGAGHVTLTDEFVELAVPTLQLTEDGCDAPIIVRGSGGAILTMLRTIHPSKGVHVGPRRAEGHPAARADCTAKNLKELPQEGAWREFVVGRS